MPVAFERVPQSEELPMKLSDWLGPALKYLIIAVFSTCAVFFATFILFVRYDVR